MTICKPQHGMERENCVYIWIQYEHYVNAAILDHKNQNSKRVKEREKRKFFRLDILYAVHLMTFN